MFPSLFIANAFSDSIGHQTCGDLVGITLTLKVHTKFILELSGQVGKFEHSHMDSMDTIEEVFYFHTRCQI